ncbi:protein GRIP-like [Pyrus ussuriensis x Pyrus communis]|uniref:Protein GRIP-like n=1 Tax=Pyrus ussuriensis x Pyrus communis TaxID=2448454 RepID=A0A5N5I2W9_9ROSA|nr:protein GRIP-like [Pyrus ussuriensis x Pyrus communis]
MRSNGGEICVFYVDSFSLVPHIFSLTAGARFDHHPGHIQHAARRSTALSEPEGRWRTGGGESVAENDRIVECRALEEKQILAAAEWRRWL